MEIIFQCLFLCKKKKKKFLVLKTHQMQAQLHKPPSTTQNSRLGRKKPPKPSPTIQKSRSESQKYPQTQIKNPKRKPTNTEPNQKIYSKSSSGKIKAATKTPRPATISQIPMDFVGEKRRGRREVCARKKVGSANDGGWHRSVGGTAGLWERRISG